MFLNFENNFLSLKLGIAEGWINKILFPPKDKTADFQFALLFI